MNSKRTGGRKVEQCTSIKGPLARRIGRSECSDSFADSVEIAFRVGGGRKVVIDVRGNRRKLVGDLLVLRRKEVNHVVRINIGPTFSGAFRGRWCWLAATAGARHQSINTSKSFVDSHICLLEHGCDLWMVGCIDGNSDLPDLLQFIGVRLGLSKIFQLWTEQLPLDGVDDAVHSCEIGKGVLRYLVP